MGIPLEQLSAGCLLDVKGTVAIETGYRNGTAVAGQGKLQPLQPIVNGGGVNIGLTPWGNLSKI